MSKNRERMWIPENGSPDIAAKKPDIHVKMCAGSLAGFVEIDLIDAKSGRIKKHYEFPNMILTAGMDGLLNGNTLISMIQNLNIGTGSTAVTPDDLGLDEEVDNTSANGGIVDTFGYQTGSATGFFGLGNPYHFIRTTRVFTEGEANFPTLSELGFRQLGTPEFQLTRALIADVTGSPITIEKTSADQLRITYEIRGYVPASNANTGSFVLADSETSHSFTASAQDIDRADQGRGFVFSLRSQAGPDPRGFFRDLGSFGGSAQMTPSASAPGNPTGTAQEWGWSIAGVGFSDSQSLNQPYISGSLTRTNIATWEPSSAAFASGGIQGMNWKYSGNTNGEYNFAMYFTPSIKKTDLDRLTLGYSLTITASTTASA